MPLRDGACDVVVGDGFLSNMSYPEGYRTIKEELRRVLEPSGILAMRLFARRGQSEPPAEVLDAMRAGMIGSSSAFRLRLLISAQKDLNRARSWPTCGRPGTGPLGIRRGSPGLAAGPPVR